MGLCSDGIEVPGYIVGGAVVAGGSVVAGFPADGTLSWPTLFRPARKPSSLLRAAVVGNGPRTGFATVAAAGGGVSAGLSAGDIVRLSASAFGTADFSVSSSCTITLGLSGAFVSVAFSPDAESGLGSRAASLARWPAGASSGETSRNSPTPLARLMTAGSAGAIVVVTVPSDRVTW
jgi:hypothetical protein